MRDLWATPTTQDTKHSNIKLNAKGRRMATNGGGCFSLNIADQVSLTSPVGYHGVEWTEAIMGLTRKFTTMESSWL